MSARRKARKRVLDVLYASDVRGVALSELIDSESLRAESDSARSSSWEYARTLLEGLREDMDEVDALIAAQSSWPMDRMPAVDRAIARMATWELIRERDTPTAVIVSEAGELASEYSTDESRSFLQGLLGGIAQSQRDTP